MIPFKATVDVEAKPVPYRLTVVAVLIGPLVGLIEVNVGAGGFAIVAVTALDSAGVAVLDVTVTEAVPKEVKRFAGTFTIK